MITESGEAANASLMDAVGIVDPFLRRNMVAGEKFWAWIRPGSISTLTHKWTHKRIPDVVEVVPDKEAARVRLEEFAEGSLHVPLDEMLAVINSCVDGGDPLYDHGYESLCEYEGFWEDYTLYTGKPDPHKEDGCFYFFTCGGCS